MSTRHLGPVHTTGRALAARHRPRGFTLIEAVIAMGVIALLMSLALPSFNDMVARARLRAAAEDLAIGLGNARLESLRPGAGTAGGERHWRSRAQRGCRARRRPVRAWPRAAVKRG